MAELVDRILLARHGGIDPDVEAAWKTEIDRRIKEIEEGKVEGIPLEESLARIRKIAASPVVLEDYLPDILRAVQKSFPKLSFTLRHGLQPQIEELLEDHKVDLAVAVSEHKPPPDCASETLVHLPLVLLVPADSPLQSATELWEQDRISDKLIAPSEDDVLTRYFRRGLEERHVDWNLGIELNSVDVIETFVSKGCEGGSLRSGLQVRTAQNSVMNRKTGTRCR